MPRFPTFASTAWSTSASAINVRATGQTLSAASPALEDAALICILARLPDVCLPLTAAE